jgi:glycosyltransferase involved in cell wall biosynthesis
MVMTRYLPHFRREVFRRLSQTTEFEVHFIHSAEVPVNDTGITTDPLPSSHIVPIKDIGFGSKALVYQPKSLGLVMRYNPDVIVCESPPNFVSVGLAALLQRIRGQGVIFWTKGVSFKDRIRLLYPLRELIKRAWFSLPNVLVGYGQSSRAYFEGIGIAGDRIVIAQNSVDTTTLLREPERWRERGLRLRERLQLGDQKVIATVCRLTGPKRVDLLVEAAGRLSTAGARITVLIGGEGPERAALEQQATKYPGLDVRFLGKLPSGEDNVVFSAADINVFPARTGLAIVQSMALFKPTIIADEPFADAELIIHNETGLRYTPYQVESLTAEIRRVLDDRDLATRLGTNGHDFVMQNATIENMVAKLQEAIALALKVRRRARKHAPEA